VPGTKSTTVRFDYTLSGTGWANGDEFPVSRLLVLKKFLRCAPVNHMTKEQKPEMTKSSFRNDLALLARPR